MRRLRWFGVVDGRLLWTGTKGAVVLGRYQEVGMGTSVPLCNILF